MKQVITQKRGLTFNKLLLLVVFMLAFVGLHAQTAQDFERHVKILAADSLEGRGLGTKGHALAHEYLVGQFREIGLSTWFDNYTQDFAFKQSITWTAGKNIVGYVEGTDPKLKDEYIVIGGHYDHVGYEMGSDGKKVIYPGADDNASGTAMTIELARYFAKEENRTKRSIIFILFDAEESGLIGANHFVKESPVPIDQIQLMFSLDMVGMLETNKGLVLKGIGLLEGGADMASSLAANHDIKLKSISSNLERRTDTYPFGQAGIPSAHVFTGLVSPYHKPEDKYDLLEYEGMVKINAFMQAFVAQLGNEQQLEKSSSMDKLAASGIGEGKSRAIRYGATSFIGGSYIDFRDQALRTNSATTLGLGVNSIFRLSSILRLQQDVMVEMNGSQSTDADLEVAPLRRFGVLLPLQLQLVTNEKFSTTERAFISAGAYYRNFFASRLSGEEIPFEADGLNGDEWGLSFGVGFEIQGFMFSSHYRYALTDAFDGPIGTRDRTFGVSLTYLFK
ncbi:MAG: M20/M25/M40 family metallo-hydrolase [Cyclobacteriaceae bacterium]|nr:M20/M25/M40 family metallo-hydrolase [Cyclobacteriaceae bacterium]MCH8516948.1 M20/M25/M40 family metallo-hydrolase [Cyclobacteriaceae bacterium]